MKNAAIQKLWKENYIAAIQGATGSKSFQTFYVKEDGEKKDVLRGGELSCAYFVSSVLSRFNLTETTHTTVDITVEDMKNSGWSEVKQAQAGDVIVWVSQVDEHDEQHKHIGFFMGDHLAISNSEEQGVPVEHNWKFEKADGGQREIEAIYTFDKWESLHNATA